MKTYLYILAILFATTSWTQEKFTLEQIFNTSELQGEVLHGVRWMPNGKSFVYVKGGGIVQYDVASGKTNLLVCGKDLNTNGKQIKLTPCLISPNGKFFIFTGSLVARSIKTGGNFFYYDLETKKIEALTDSKQEQKIIQISPDSTKVGFVRANDLFIMDLDTRKERRLTTDGSENIINGNFDWVYEEEFGVINGWKWSPDGSHIAYWQLDQSDIATFPLISYREAHPKIRYMRYPKAGDRNSRVRVGVVSLDTGKTVWMDIGKERDIYIPRINWLPDGKTLAIQRLNRDQNKLELLLANIATGDSQAVLTETENTWVSVRSDLRFLKNGQFIWSSERSGYLHLYLYNGDGTLARQLTKGNWEVSWLATVDEQRRKAYFVASRPTPFERQLFCVNLNTGKLRQLSSVHGMHSARISPDKEYYLDNYSNLNTMPQTVLCQIDGTVIRSVVKNSKEKLRNYAWGKSEFFSFETDDGVRLNGCMLKPHNFDPAKKYPVLMYVYGGPGSQTALDYWDNRAKNKFLWHHFLTQKGYVIVTVDNRGTGARGKKFKSVTYKNLGFWETYDQMQAAAYLAKLSWVDEKRIGIWGWSYGGYMTLLSMCKGGSLFKAGISVAPVTHWKYYDTIYTERYMSTPQKNPKGYTASSPITHVKGLCGKLLMAHGTGDDNVHFQNTVSFTDAMIAENKQFQLLIYPYRTHGIYEGKNTVLHLFTAMTNFILKNL